MRHRRAGRSDVEVPEVGSRVRTLTADAVAHRDELRDGDFGAAPLHEMPVKSSTGG